MTHYFGLSHVLATDYYVLKKLLYFLYTRISLLMRKSSLSFESCVILGILISPNCRHNSRSFYSSIEYTIKGSCCQLSSGKGQSLSCVTQLFQE